MRIDELTPTSAILAEYGARLAVVRKGHGITQQALADAAGIGVATLRRIEDGNDAQWGSWIKILKALGMEGPLDALLPETYASPMAEAKGGRRRAARPSEGDGSASFRWGDETP